MNRFILGALALVFCVQATASVVFSPAVSYSSTSTEEAGISTESSTLVGDIRLGYVFNMGLYVGAMYQIETTDNNGSNPSAFNVGPTLGYYHKGGFYGLVTYHLLGESKDIPAVGNTYTDAQGPQVDLGWVFPLASSFSIGPQITWRQLEYGNFDDGTNPAVPSDRSVTEVRPYLSLWFMF